MARQRGMTSQAMWALAESVWMLHDVGSWDRLLERADEVSAWDAEHGSGYYRALVGPYRARVQLHRGGRERGSHVPDYLRFARQSDDLQVLAPALATFAMARAEADAPADALAAIEELDGLSRERSAAYREAHLPDLVETCVRLRRLDVAEGLLEDTEGTQPRQRHCIRTAEAILAGARGDHEAALSAFDEARDAWAAFGCAFERARADLGAGLALRALERVDEAAERLDAAGSTFEELGAEPWVTLARGAP
jgi:tetratricopeptide (TPR) repeat protein